MKSIMKNMANRKIILTVIVHVLLVGITMFFLGAALVGSFKFISYMLNDRLFEFPMLAFFLDVCLFIKSYFWGLIPVFIAIIYLDYLLCSYLMKRLGKRFIPWSYFAVAFVSIVIMGLVLFSLGDYLLYHAKLLERQYSLVGKQ